MAEHVKQIKNRPGRGPARRVSLAEIRGSWHTFARLFTYIGKNYAAGMVLVVVSIFVSVIANVQGTLFTRTLIDGYITPLSQTAAAGQKVDYTPLFNAISRVALFYLIGIAASLVQTILMTFISQGTMRRLRIDLFDHMESLPIKYFDTHAHGDIMSIYTNDIDTLRQMIGQSLPQMLNSAITIVSIFVGMLTLSIPLTALSILMVVVMIFCSGAATRISGRNFVLQQNSIGTLNGFIEESMNGEKVIKVFNHEPEMIEKFDLLNEELYQSAYKATAYSNILGPINAQLGNTSYVLCALLGGLISVNGLLGFSVGALASFLTFNKNFGMPINQVSMQFNSVIMAMAGAERIFKLLDEEPEQDDGYVSLVNVRENSDGAKTLDEEGPDGVVRKVYTGLVETKENTGKWAWKHFHKQTGTTTYVPLEGDITFNHVDFGYNSDKIILHDIVLHAKPGQKIALVGSTGAGKTTITNLINRFYDIQDGKIRFDNININKIQKPDLRRSLGLVLQDTNLFKGTVADNIRYGRLDATDEEVEQAAKLVNADGFIRRLPNGYQTVLHENGSNLSQGQRQLLTIARAAIADPPALILDEATSSIDTRTERIVQQGMDQLMRGRTTFVIAHRLSTIKNSDVILVLEHGRIIERGNHEELLMKKGRYYQLYTGNKPENAEEA